MRRAIAAGLAGAAIALAGAAAIAAAAAVTLELGERRRITR